MRHRLYLPLLALVAGQAGCVTHQYTPDQVTRGQAPDMIRFLENDQPSASTGPLQGQYLGPLQGQYLPPSGPLPPPFLAGPLPPMMPAPGTGAILPVAGTITPVTPPEEPKRSFRQRVARFFTSSPTTGGMTLPSPHYLQHPPQYFPPDPAFPLASEPNVLPMSITGGSFMVPKPGAAMTPQVTLDPAVAAQIPNVVMPKAVAPPTAEQANAVPLEVIKALQTGAFDPNVMPAGGKAVATIGAPPAPNNVATAEPAAKANPLDGTAWVRATEGGRTVVRFTKDRIEAVLTLADGFTLELTGDYAAGKDSTVFGVLTLIECHGGGEYDLVAKLPASVNSPFSFRLRAEDGALSLTELRGGPLDHNFARERPAELRRVTGKFTRTTAAELEKLTPLCVPTPRKPKSDQTTPHAPLPPASGVMMGTPAAPRSGLESALEFVHTLLKENPQTVQQLAAELGRGVGGWVGKSSGNARAGEVVGGMVGTALAAKLTAMSAPANPEAGGFQSLIYWLGGTAEPEGR